jgi:ABC-type polysaccharide/polyol phosphate transport system ATPase subunit
MISSAAAESAPAAKTPPPGAAALLDHVSVRYRVPVGGAGSLKEHAIQRLRRRGSHREHEALADVTLQIAAGESVAIIGPNGSGKTTMLRLIARVLKPTSGRVRVHGRVAPILDLVGVSHPELTGRENVLLNGALLGFSRREMSERVDRILEFAEIGDFADAPLRTYSSGMAARLGFAIVSDTAADIVIVDEALGVGDRRFQEKCATRIETIRRAGVTFILVTHDMQSVLRLCSRAVCLDRGRVRQLGAAADVVNAYLAPTAINGSGV